MAELSKDDVGALGRAAGLTIQEPELTEVTYSLNALLQALEALNPPELDRVEPLPILLPNR
jgi:Asp-tRNA(Asn)/Glu-tRNA(Gln) amidotransferase C subunit